jgi:serine/threonine protein kinase
MDLDYELGLQRVKEALRQKYGQLPHEFEVLEFRLLDNLRDGLLYGQDQANKTEQAKIKDALNQKTREWLDRSFIEFCALQDERNASESAAPPQAPAASPAERREQDLSWLDARTIMVHDEEYMLYRDSVRENWTSDGGAVWRCAKAQHLETNQRIWLKQVHMMRPSQEGEKLRNFLEKEHRLLTKLEHEQDFPHAFLRPLSQGHDYTIAHTARDGKTFAQIFSQVGKLPDRYLLHSLLKSVLPLCKALNTLHRMQYSHRLLSPEAILIAPGQRAVLLDLGLAAWSPFVGEGQDAYQAPEQRFFNIPPVLPGPRTDIYRLGATLYVTLTGQPVSTASAQIKPSDYNGAISPTLDEAILRAVATRPGDRWQTINEFSAALKRALSGLSFSDKEPERRSDA